MLRLSKPVECAGDTFAVCIDRIRNAQLKARLQGAQASISLAETAYELKASDRTLHTVLANNTVGGVSKDEMVAVYDYRMAAKLSPGRAIYDRLKVVPQDKCPYCAHRDVSTLDHFLDKAVHPAFAVTPVNLVPSCIECNKAKSGKLPLQAEGVLFHPYFDDFGPARWLVAEVVQGSPAAVVFSVGEVPEWTGESTARAMNHFDTFGLGQLYSIQAGREISQIRLNLKVQFDAGGAEQVRAELERQAMSRAVANLNSWQSATYEALSNSDWFCDGGFA